MIDEKKTKKYCCEDICLIENYEQAMNDTTQTWHCHHRDEIRTLPSGMTVVRSRQDLKDACRYYSCPASELIFLTKAEHRRLHNVNMTAETRKKLSDTMKNRTHSDETKRKISEIMKDKPRKPFTDEHRRKLSEAHKAYWAKKKFVI